jgi:DNA-binding transcriptional MerR regulator
MSVNQGTMRIGEVHAQLRKDFPDVELSKIRYYEDKGLVRPSRSRKGYRLYSERDVACLREAIRLAQEEFVPLRVVRLRLIEQGLLSEAPPAPTSRQAARDAATSVVSAPVPNGAAPVPTPRPVLNVVPQRPAPTSQPSTSDDPVAAERPVSAMERFSVNELLAMTGVAPEEFNQIQALGLVTPFVVDGQTTYGPLDVRVVAHARALLVRGVDARLLGSLKRIAEREVGVVEDATAALHLGGAEAPDEQTRSLVREVAREVGALRGVLIERELGAYLRD